MGTNDMARCIDFPSPLPQRRSTLIHTSLIIFSKSHLPHKVGRVIEQDADTGEGYRCFPSPEQEANCLCRLRPEQNSKEKRLR